MTFINVYQYRINNNNWKELKRKWNKIHFEYWQILYTILRKRIVTNAED